MEKATTLVLAVLVMAAGSATALASNRADINDDGIVNMPDIALVCDNWLWTAGEPNEGPTLQQRGFPAATFVVASSKYSKHKQAGDYICSGWRDDIQIQQAIDDLPPGGGRIVLLDGIFLIGSPIEIRHNCLIQGQGICATTLALAPGANCNMFEYTQTGSSVGFFALTDLYMDGNKSNNTAGSGLVTNAYLIDVHLKGVMMMKFAERGVYAGITWGWVFDDVIIEYCDGDGVWLHNGTGFKMLNCKIMENSGHGVVADESHNGLINSCQLRGAVNKAAVHLHGGQRNIIVNNYIQGHSPGDGVLLESSDSSAARDNIISNNFFRGLPFDYGIRVADADCVGNAFLDNKIERVQTAAVSDTAGKNLIRNNNGFTTASAGNGSITGDGTATVFYIPHYLSLPEPAGNSAIAIVTARNSNMAGAEFFAEVSGSNIKLTFSTAPANGADYLFGWRAEYSAEGEPDDLTVVAASSTGAPRP